MDLSQFQIVVAFCGPSGSGKDTIVDHFINKGIFAKKASFADYLKNLCSKLTKLPKDYFYNKKDEPLEKPFRLDEKQVLYIAEEVRRAVPYDVLPYDKFKPAKIRRDKYIMKEMKTPREILQYVGTEVMKDFFGPVHAYLTCNQVKKSNGVIGISDLRFVDELETCNNFFKFFYPIRIVGRNEKTGDLHRSEVEYKTLKVFAEIKNDGTLEDLFDSVESVLKNIKKDLQEKLSKLSNDEIERLKSKETKNGKAVFV